MFTDILNAIRNQSLTDEHHDILLSQVEHDRDYVSEYTQLYTHNANVDSMNAQVFDSIFVCKEKRKSIKYLIKLFYIQVLETY